MTRKHIIVVGGGGAGLMAAGQAATAGAQITLLEKMGRPGRKICISGKGRCNLTNSADLQDFILHFGKNGRFLHQAFHHFFNTDLIEFFEGLGLPLATERGGRVFPVSGKAPDVLKALQRWLAQCKVQPQTASPVENLLVKDDHITGVVSKGQPLHGDAVILATGGASYPATGSTGDGYGLCKSVGHTIVPIRPALVPLTTPAGTTTGLAGLSLRNIQARLFVNGKRKLQTFGELLFTESGLSGPVILTMSSLVVDLLQQNKTLSLRIDLKPALSEQKLDARLLRDFDSRHQEELASVLRGLLPRELVALCLHQVGIDAETPAGNVRTKERRRLRSWLKELRFDITGYRGFDEAIVTAGGVALKEINPQTMESKKVQGLYIAGELLDLHGDTGGYNLQAAFSTGYLAGRSAAEV